MQKNQQIFSVLANKMVYQLPNLVFRYAKKYVAEY